MHVSDLKAFFFLYGFSGRALWLDWMIVCVGEYLLYPILGVFAYQTYSAWASGDQASLFGYGVAFVGALIARLGVSEVVHVFVRRARPYNTLGLPHLLSNTTYSFPSGHTIFLFALGVGVLFVESKEACVLLLLGLCVGLARVMAGVHYPSDIVGGMVLGAMTGYAARLCGPLLLRALGV